MKPRKIAVLATAAIASFFLSGAILYHQAFDLPDAIEIHVQGQPTIGNGNIEFVIFEDFRCANCCAFNEKIFPQISARYIETGRARYTIVPLAFMEGSELLANAALSVYRQAPDRFILFVQELSSSHALTRREILWVAQNVGGIDLDDLAQSLDARLYYHVLEENLKWAKQLMGRQFRAPALFINGIATSTDSFEAIEQRIEQIEKRRR